MADTQAQKAFDARVAARTAELMVTYPEASVDFCLRIASLEERIINGDPDGPTPKGILNS